MATLDLLLVFKVFCANIDFRLNINNITYCKNTYEKCYR